LIVEHPRIAIQNLLDQLKPVSQTSVSIDAAAGRVLAEPVYSDRDSPACNVSAMDGYAVHLADLSLPSLPVLTEVAMGQAPPKLQPGSAVRIFTGGAVPDGADAVIRREDTEESPESIRLQVAPHTVRLGQNIRRQGENIKQHDQVIPAGTMIDTATVGAMATFGHLTPRVHRPVRVAVVTTGSEVISADTNVNAWQVRDSNGPVLRDRLSAWPWTQCVSCASVSEDPAKLRRAIEQALPSCDAIWLTGGVSMGDHDSVPRRHRGDGGYHRFSPPTDSPWQADARCGDGDRSSGVGVPRQPRFGFDHVQSFW